DPVDVGRLHDERAFAISHEQSMERVVRWRGRGGMLCEQLLQTTCEIAFVPVRELALRTCEHGAEAVVIERLEQVVERLHVERAQRIRLVCRDEYERG